MEYSSSLYRKVSVGTVVQDKNDGSPFISVYMKEMLPFHTGNITDDVVNIVRNGIDMDGVAYNVTLQRTLAVKAQWKRTPNRITSPNVRAGMDVEIWEAGNSGKYFWVEMGGNDHLKRQESVTYGWNASGTPITENEPSTSENKYTATVDTKNGFAEFKTTMANGEKAMYRFQINGKDGHATLTDHLGNIIQISSEDNGLSFTNADKTTINAHGKHIYMECDETAVVKAKKIQAIYSESASLEHKNGTSIILTPDSITGKATNIKWDGEVEITGGLNVAKNITAPTADIPVLHGTADNALQAFDN